jgi:hypothetical protein
MEPITWIFVGLLVLALFSLPRGKAPANAVETYVYVEKNCPPHKWNWVEVKDQDGNVVTEKLVCKLCGPIKPMV